MGYRTTERVNKPMYMKSNSFLTQGRGKLKLVLLVHDKKGALRMMGSSYFAACRIFSFNLKKRSYSLYELYISIVFTLCNLGTDINDE